MGELLGRNFFGVEWRLNGDGAYMHISYGARRRRHQDRFWTYFDFTGCDNKEANEEETVESTSYIILPHSQSASFHVLSSLHVGFGGYEQV